MSKRRSSILIDFLLVVILTVMIMVSIMTYFNIIFQKKAVLKEVSNNSKYISLTVKQLAMNAIENGEVEPFRKNLELLLTKEKGKIYEIALYKIKDDNNAEVIYSSVSENIGSVIENKGLKELLGAEEFIEGENIHEKVHTYDYIYSLKKEKEVQNVHQEEKKEEKAETEIAGVMSVIVSMKEFDEANKGLMLVNMITAILAIVLIIVITTLMLLNRIYNPITQLIKELRKIIDGEINYEVSLSVNNELSLLAEEINEMKSHIWESTMENRLASPITGLPGLMHSIENINDKIYNDEFFGVLAITLRNLEPFVLKYGFTKGEEVLRLMADIVQETLKETKITDGKLSQMKENTFLIVLKPEETTEVAWKIIDKFQVDIMSLFGEEEMQNGKINLVTSEGVGTEHSLLNILISGMTNKVRGEIKSYKDVEDKIIASEVEYAESNDESQFIICDEINKGRNFRESAETEKGKSKANISKGSAKGSNKKEEEKKEETSDDDDLLSAILQ